MSLLKILTKENYRLFKRKIYYVKFLNTISKSYSPGLFVDKESDANLDIVSIVYNDTSMLEYQVLLIRKFLIDRFTLIIADNSSNEKIRLDVIEKCNKLKVHYVIVPEHHYQKNESHGAAMHWVYKNVLKKRNAKYFGFIDHDIFPVSENSIVSKLSKKIYGRVLAPDYKPYEYLLSDNKYWSIWAGFSFYESELFKRVNVYRFHFFPIITENGVLDTGGGLWKSVYSKITFPGQLANYRYIRFRHSEQNEIQSDYYESIDEWVHMINLSEWRETCDREEKLQFFNKWIDRLLNE